MAVNSSVIGASNWFNNTIRNSGQKEAPGSASNNTIAAAATTTQQTPATPARTTPSRSNTQTGKKKDDDRRSQSAGASALQESINSGKSTSTKSTGNTPTQPTVKPNISGVVTETQTGAIKSIEQTNVAKGLTSKAGLYDVGINIEASQIVTPTRSTNYVSPQQAQDFFDATGGLKLSGGQDARQIIETQTDKAIKSDPIIGNIYSTVQTVFTDPVGRPNLTNNIFEQFDAYDRYDGSGDQRKTAAVLAAVEIPSYIIGGGAAGVGTKVVQNTLTKLGTSKIGAEVVRAASSPILANEFIENIYVPDVAFKLYNRINDLELPFPIKKIINKANPLDIQISTRKIASSIAPATSPYVLGANALAFGYYADIVNRIRSQQSPEGKISTAANIALKELPFGAFGSVKGYMAANLVGSSIKTRGASYVSPEKIIAPGIPLGNYNEKQLTESFEKNILIPQPFKFAQVTNDIGTNTASSVTARLNSKNEPFTELYHTTGYGEYFGKNIVVRDSDSEYGGIFVAPKAIDYFLRGTDKQIIKPSFFITNFKLPYNPNIINFRSKGVKSVNWEKVARDSGLSIKEVRDGSPEIQKNAVDKFLKSEAEINPGFAYMPIDKYEYEAVLPQGLKFKRLPIRYYTKINNIRIPIKEYELIDVNKGKKSVTPTGNIPSFSAEPRSPSRKSGFNTPLYFDTPRSSSRNYVSAGSPVSLYSGSTRSSSAGGKSSIRDSFTAQLSEISRDSPQKTTKTAYTTTQTNYNSPVKTTTRGNSLYSNITANKATPQKITPIDTNYLSRKSNQLIKRQKKPTDERKETEKLYSAVRTGRIDHLSIKDPLEFYGTGKSITNRNRPDRVLNKQALYFVDNAITTRRPTGRRKVKP